VTITPGDLTSLGPLQKGVYSQIAIGDSEVSKSAVVHFADSSRIYPEVREVPEPDSCTTAFDHLVGVGEHLIRHIVD
jgi:hypothetical protein